jgi:arginyl-tRNA synthetase
VRQAIGSNPDQYQIEDCNAVAKVMGINPLVFQELSSRKGHCNGLDFNLLTLSEGETGTNLQLCYSRLCLAITKIGTNPSQEEIPYIDYASLSDPPWSELLRLMARHPDATQSAFERLEPGTILPYLFRVAELTLCVDEADEEESDGEGPVAASKNAARAVLYKNVRQVLENGMKLLWTTPISK